MKLDPLLRSLVLRATSASDVGDALLIQSLWSGYGKILRVPLAYDVSDPANSASVIVKHVSPPCGQQDSPGNSHPRGWNTDQSHQRKVRSYDVEATWYREYSDRCDATCRVPVCLLAESIEGQWVFVLEDLDASGFATRKSHLDRDGVFVVLAWLAHFHATFLSEPLEGLWPVGTYWHLATRLDEWQVMQPGKLKEAAAAIDARLNACRYQTAVHGDAKVANFCFSPDGTRTAAVYFQYVGRGCGMKDVAYFLSSCVSEVECERNESVYLDFYFRALRQSLTSRNSMIDANALEAEWRAMYPFAWADFTRFLLGWCPEHHKLNRYSQRITEQVLAE